MIRCDIHEADGFLSRTVEYVYNEDGSRASNVIDHERK